MQAADCVRAHLAARQCPCWYVGPDDPDLPKGADGGR